MVSIDQSHFALILISGVPTKSGFRHGKCGASMDQISGQDAFFPHEASVLSAQIIYNNQGKWNPRWKQSSTKKPTGLRHSWDENVHPLFRKNDSPTGGHLYSTLYIKRYHQVPFLFSESVACGMVLSTQFEHNQRNPHARVVGGNECPKGECPWQVNRVQSCHQVLWFL